MVSLLLLIHTLIGLKETTLRTLTSTTKEMLSVMKSLTSADLKTFEEEDAAVVPPPDVVAYNELRSCADLYRMYDAKVLNIKPDFQRDVVWSPAAMTRFIDSLIKQLPIPSMCFSLDYKTQKWQVIDGLQRMSSIIQFLDKDSDWVLSNLSDIDPQIAGRRVKDFQDSDSPLGLLRQKVENMSIPVTVLRCDYSKSEHAAYLFTIFHRLNTGGTRLTNQEIRNCIYTSDFNTCLKELNKDEHWIELTRQDKKNNRRYVWIEQILRFFAFHKELLTYEGNLSKFLNDYMRRQKSLTSNELDQMGALFKQTVLLVVSLIKKEDDTTWSRTFLETLMIGLAINIEHVSLIGQEQLEHYFDKLRQEPSLSSDALKDDLSSKDKVLARLQAAQRIFSGL